MKKYLIIMFLLFPVSVWGAPVTSMSITPSASDGTVIEASDENTRNNAVSTTFNAHDHNDIDQTANTVSLGDATSGNKTIQANNADSDKPFLRYDDTNDRWVVSRDGTNTTTLVVWSGTTGTNFILPQSPAIYDIIYHNGAAWRTLAAGTSGQFLRTGGTTAAPSFASSTAYKIVSFTRDVTTASGTQAVTGVGFTPQSVFFLVATAADNNTSWGFSTASENMVIFDNGDAAADTYGVETDRSVQIEQAAGARYHGAMSSFNSDGFTFSWTKVGSPTGTITILAFCFR